MWAVAEYSGNKISGCFDDETYQGGEDTNFNTPTLTTDTENELFFGALIAKKYIIPDSGSIAWDSLFDERHQDVSGNWELWIADRICTSEPKTDSASGDLHDTGDYYLALLATFRGN